MASHSNLVLPPSIAHTLQNAEKELGCSLDIPARQLCTFATEGCRLLYEVDFCTAYSYFGGWDASEAATVADQVRVQLAGWKVAIAVAQAKVQFVELLEWICRAERAAAL